MLMMQNSEEVFLPEYKLEPEDLIEILFDYPSDKRDIEYEDSLKYIQISYPVVILWFADGDKNLEPEYLDYDEIEQITIRTR
jgi:hypothetical protein